MPLSCPDCSGALNMKYEGPRSHGLYVCQVGHRYSTRSLLHAKEKQLEEILWSAIVQMKHVQLVYESLAREMPRLTGTERKQAQRRIEELRKQRAALRAQIEVVDALE